jgi:hypothetical protein
VELDCRGNWIKYAEQVVQMSEVNEMMLQSEFEMHDFQRLKTMIGKRTPA